MACEAYFHNLCVLLGFLPVAIAGYWLMPGRRWKLAWLVAGSLTFYGFWDVRFIPLLLASAFLDYLVGLRLEASTRKRFWLVVSVAFNLGVLAVFKYAMWATDSAQSFLQIIGSSASLPGVNIVLPVGISFYTFQSMSYTIDVYRGKVPATRDPLKYLAFVTLFPQLVAGPIVRYKDLSEQLDQLPTRLTQAAAATGLTLFAIGLFKKVVIADNIAGQIDALWAFAPHMDLLEAWVATVGYTLQLYFDFSGYSDMAIGLGALLGLRLPVNFRAPYQAKDPSDFWQRWHISLSTYLKDYLYIPLGGNRVDKLRLASNLMLVMALGGLWHGANTTFLIWGVYHGFLLMFFHAVKPWWRRMPSLAQQGATLFAVTMGWVIFRAQSVTDAMYVYYALFDLTNLGTWALYGTLLLVLLGLLAFAAWARPSSEYQIQPTWRHAALTAAALSLALLLLRHGESAFLYYQF